MFQKAVRRQVVLKLAITGPSGSGKTYSALRLASGLGKKIAVIDTENGSASLYSDKFNFDVVTMEPPFTTERYEHVIKEAEKAGYDILIIDSITHAWAGEGGLLEQKEQLDARGKGNSYTNWATITKKHEAFKSAMLHSPIHIIATMRSKEEYFQGEENGKKVVRKLGLAPIQRDGMSYEFSIVFECAMNHEAEASKDRTGLFAGKIFKITEDTGKTILDWLNSAPKAEPITEGVGERSSPPPTPFMTHAKYLSEAQVKRLRVIRQKAGVSVEELVKICQEKYGFGEPLLLDQNQYDVVCSHLENLKTIKDFVKKGNVESVDPAAMEVPF